MPNSPFGTAPNQIARHGDFGPLAYMRPEDLILPYMHVRDEKSIGTNGGAATANTYHDRTLNTVVENTIIGASLASNQITLPAGKYDITVRAPAYSTNQSKVYLYNVTDSARSIVGDSVFSGGTVSTPLFAQGRITINATKVFKVQQLATAANADGLGHAVNNLSGAGSGVEVYTNVYITKVG